MAMRYRAAAFYGLVFDGGEREGDWCERRDKTLLALPPYGDTAFAIAARESMVRLNADVGDEIFSLPSASAEWDEHLRAWCESSGRPWSQPRWWIAGAYL